MSFICLASIQAIPYIIIDLLSESKLIYKVVFTGDKGVTWIFTSCLLQNVIGLLFSHYPLLWQYSLEGHNTRIKFLLVLRWVPKDMTHFLTRVPPLMSRYKTIKVRAQISIKDLNLSLKELSRNL